MIEVILISGKKETMENMILARIQKDREGKDLMKVCSFTKMSALKREYAVKSSSTSNKKYDVTINCCPSSSCLDFMKNGKVVCCKKNFFPNFSSNLQRMA